jgi:hypothetical protein
MFRLHPPPNGSVTHYHPPTFFSLSLSPAEDKQESFSIMKMKMYVILDEAKPHTENIKGLNLAAVIYTTVQVSILR